MDVEVIKKRIERRGRINASISALREKELLTISKLKSQHHTLTNEKLKKVKQFLGLPDAKVKRLAREIMPDFAGSENVAKCVIDEFYNKTVVHELKKYSSSAANHKTKESKSPTLLGVKTSVKMSDKRKRKFTRKFIISNDFLLTYEWVKLRYEVLVEDGAVCVCCGATPKQGAIMNVDHIVPRRVNHELALERSNLQVLCSACNHGKGNIDQTDWRN